MTTCIILNPKSRQNSCWESIYRDGSLQKPQLGHALAPHNYWLPINLIKLQQLKILPFLFVLFVCLFLFACFVFYSGIPKAWLKFTKWIHNVSKIFSMIQMFRQHDRWNGISLCSWKYVIWFHVGIEKWVFSTYRIARSSCFLRRKRLTQKSLWKKWCQLYNSYLILNIW